MKIFEEIISLLEHYNLRRSSSVLKEEIRQKENLYIEKDKESFIKSMTNKDANNLKSKDLIKQHISEIKKNNQKERVIRQASETFGGTQYQPDTNPATNQMSRVLFC
jgi:nucleosome binding factor SPN SPT16 subunit